MGILLKLILFIVVFALEYGVKIFLGLPIWFIILLVYALHALIDEIATLRDSSRLKDEQEIAKREIDRDCSRQHKLVDAFCDFMKPTFVNKIFK